ncbi:MAG: ribosome biogenesis GTPase Der, partial [Candidatus Zixiibacteriota bacterium]
GKSSFINKLLGEDRLIVSEKAGTTRDAVDTPYELDGQKYLLVDTAGLRRKFKVRENLEFYTNLRSNKAIDDCDVGVVLIDGSEGMTAQDQRVLASVIESRRPAVLAVNKWDLVEKDSLTADRFAAEINRDLARLSFIPMVFCSALTGQRITRIMSKVNDVHEQNRRRIPTSELNDFLKKVYARKKPPARNRKYIRFKYVTQSEISPPTFVFFANHPKLIDRSYVSYLANQLRADFGFEGVPIRLKFRRS